MAHAPIFDVVVESWSGGKTARPQAVAATCKSCAKQFRATEGPRAAVNIFAVYLGALHLHCPACGAEGPVQLRRLPRP